MPGIVQTQAQFREVAKKVGVLPERADQLRAASAALTPTTGAAGLRVACNAIGIYNEKADHLIAAGTTFAV